MKLPGSKVYDDQTKIHSTTQKEEVSIPKEFQKHPSNTKKNCYR